MIQNLPIYPHLEEICRKLKESPSHFLILTAETAAGKSTAVPVALLKHFSGKIIMLEPRRLAVFAIAERVSEILGEKPGGTCGYRVQLDSCVSGQTRFEVITEAILTKKLQSDPSLEGVSVVVIDEFHERSVHSDLALAFLKDAMQIRDDLYVLVMSATIETKQLSEYLGIHREGLIPNEDVKRTPAELELSEGLIPAEVFHVPGRKFPVSIEYAGNISPAKAILNELEKIRELEENSKLGKNQAENKKNTILAFFPGISDIRRCKAELEERNAFAEILVLHSSIPFSEQKKVLVPPDKSILAEKSMSDRPEIKPRVILSSAIAETSLTIPDVSTVIDTGYSRLNNFIVSSGMEKLVTQRESSFSAEQRAGRAGRTGPGKCIRLWNEHDVLALQTTPEILRCDLSSLVLECFAWGVYSAEKLSWLTPPNKNSWEASLNLLEQLGCIKKDNGKLEPHPELTDLGKAVLKMNISPRLACAAFYSPQVALEYSQFKESSPNLQKKFLAELERKISILKKEFSGCDFLKEIEASRASLNAKTLALFAGFPDRLATETQSENVYQFPSGRLARLDDSVSKPLDSKWLVAPEVDAGEKIGKIYSKVFVPTEQVEFWLSKKNRIKTNVITEFSQNRSLKKTEYRTYGKIILSEKKIQASDSEDFAQAVCTAVKKEGFSWLPLNDEIKNFLIRAEFFARANRHTKTGGNVGTFDFEAAFSGVDCSDAACLAAAEAGFVNSGAKNELSSMQQNLQKNVHEWLVPFLGGKTKVDCETVYEALRWYLCGDEIDRKVPAQITLANGKKTKVKYEERNGIIQPVIEIIIQQVFGCFETPKILGVSVLFILLSPARRPLQITDDINGFWQNSWPEICKEMKGRYPKHNWEYRKTE